jgi:hypothetical protein
VDPEAWEALYRDTSRPFPRPSTGRESRCGYASEVDDGKKVGVELVGQVTRMRKGVEERLFDLCAAVLGQSALRNQFAYACGVPTRKNCPSRSLKFVPGAMVMWQTADAAVQCL